jgi:hypothetical protein
MALNTAIQKPSMPFDKAALAGELANRIGTQNAAPFLRALEAASVSGRTFEVMVRNSGDLLTIQPSEETIEKVARIVEGAYGKRTLNTVIANISLSKIGIALTKRNEEFVYALLECGKELSGISPLLLMGILGDQPFKELLFFSEKGLSQWVEDGKGRFISPSGTPNIHEFMRYCMMVSDYDDVAKYKISESAVFLEALREPLNIFSMRMFGMNLSVAKSKTHVPHVQEGNELTLFLPDHISTFGLRADNELEFFLDALHEGSHIERGSFLLDIAGMAGMLDAAGVQVKKIEYRDNGRVKALLLVHDGKEFLATSMFHIIPFIAEKSHAGLIQYLLNVVDDLRMDSGWMAEKAPGYRTDMLRMMQEFFFDLGMREPPQKLAANDFIEGLLTVTTFLSIAEDKAKFMAALRGGACAPEYKRVVDSIRAMQPDVLKLVLDCEADILEVAGLRDRSVTRTFLATMRIYSRVKHLPMDKEGKGGNKSGMGMGGPLSLTDLDFESIELSLDPDDSCAIDPDDLPEDVRKKLEKHFEDKFKAMSEADRKKLAEEAEKMRNRKSGIPIPEPKHSPSSDWKSEIVEGVTVRNYVQVKEIELPQCPSESDYFVSSNIRNTALKIAGRRHREITGALVGEVDPYEYAAWARDRRRGIIRPRDYHLMDEDIIMRSVSIMVVGDASGSTAQVINGKRKIDYITSSVHSLAEGLSAVPGIRTAYGFFNSNGRDDIKFFRGKRFGEGLRYAKVEPDNANRDGAIMRMAGGVLSGEKSDVKIAIFINDSMPADSNEYNGARAVEDVRRAMLQLKQAGILPFVITVPPAVDYYKEKFKSVEEYLDHLYLGRANYQLINSEKDLDAAFSAFVGANLPRLKRRVVR